MRKSVISPGRVGLIAALFLLALLYLLWPEKRDAPGKPEEIKSPEVKHHKESSFPGRWRPVKHDPQGAQFSEEQRRQIEELESIGYLDGSRAAPDISNVTIFKEEKVFPGLNLYNSGHGPEAFLIDMSGKLLHKWRFEFSRLCPGCPVPENTNNHEFWRRVHLYDDGSLLAIFDGFGIIKIDKDSNLLWGYPGRSHHDMFVEEDGRIFVLTRKAGIITRIDPERPVLEDFITELDPLGKPVRSISLLEAFEKSNYSEFLKTMPEWGDIFHTNTIEILDGNPSSDILGFRKPGNALISVLYLDAIAVVDLDSCIVQWAKRSSWRRQHQPTMLDDGRILLFDNQGNSGFSQVLEFDPSDVSERWAFRGSTPKAFYSETCGSCQRLPNGNTLITESDRGRAFEVTRQGTVVWEFFNPHRAGPDNGLIATLFEVIRLPESLPFLHPKREFSD